MSYVFDQAEDASKVRAHLRAAVNAYPANRAAHKQYADWIEGKLDNDRLTQKGREPLVGELAEVMDSWSSGLPDDIKPRLWLVDYLLENERLEEARPHVQWLSASRHDDPRVRATPWKWQLLEAMRLCRRKAWLAEAPARLDEAQKLWPAWLSQGWLPYLRAALTLRLGKSEEFQAERERIWQAAEGARGSLTDACMMLGAAQLMRVPAGDLKTLRAPVEEAVKNLRRFDETDLLRLSSFFWDLHRVQLLYPAYRMHGKKIAQELHEVLRNYPNRVLDDLDDPEVQAAVFLCAEHRCFDRNYDMKLPHWFSNPAVKNHPRFTAARLHALIRRKRFYREEESKGLAPALREAAKSERDVYYRYWYVALADEWEDSLARSSANSFGFSFDLFKEMFRAGNDYGDDEDDDEYEDDDDDLI
jgi:hypothetical protein